MTAVLLVAMCGAFTGAGVWLALVSLFPPRDGARPARLRAALLGRHRPVRLAASVGAGALVLFITGWPVAGVLLAAGTWWAPVLLGPDRHHERQVAGIEAVAAWTEMLRDLMAGAAGLHQAIAATIPIAPEPVRDDVVRLTDALRQGTPPQTALRRFADDVDNPTADLVAAALTSATSRHATDLGVLLGSLAEAAREQAAMLVRAAAGRARVRTSTRIIIAVTLGMAVAMLLFSPDYLDPFDGVFGQSVLAVIGALWAAALAWLVRLSRPKLGPRVLSADAPRQTEVAA
ncbi:Flp pilus assembly protein TadB [Nocardiopsis aegyptia]|uniref:Flp pilus assembly protein TadB n=2 Tax=Nocardiopsis aegyptia TaxID=220378 RepID=A0A7Z0ETC6_9ACTN|nr:type II secretion system F family protein [Nocardiopsis aegyptia]NYJ37916.1 Flp pilus assembly protein TadB [Nocardiopsis aegyptia]